MQTAAPTQSPEATDVIERIILEKSLRKAVQSVCHGNAWAAGVHASICASAAFILHPELAEVANA